MSASRPRLTECLNRSITLDHELQALVTRLDLTNLLRTESEDPLVHTSSKDILLKDVYTLKEHVSKLELLVQNRLDGPHCKKRVRLTKGDMKELKECIHSIETRLSNARSNQTEQYIQKHSHDFKITDAPRKRS